MIIAEQVRGRAMRKDEGMVKGERRINGQCEPGSQSVLSRSALSRRVILVKESVGTVMTRVVN